MDSVRLKQFLVLASSLLSTDAAFYHQTVLNTHAGQPQCEVSEQTIGRWSNDISCVEGETILNKNNCTLQCPDNLVPSFATLYCWKGILSPPGQ